MIDILHKAAQGAGQVLLTYFNQKNAISHKSSFKDLVTEADIASQKKIYSVVMAEMKKKGFGKNDVGFIGEEKMNIDGEHKFIIDPLDGTNNFASGFEYFNVTIAYMKNGITLAGVVYNPISDAFYSGIRSKGAFKIQHKKKSRLRMIFRPLENVLAVPIFHARQQVYQKELVLTQKIFPYVRGIRLTHSTALDLANLADNVFGISFSGMCSIWDVAAGKLLVEESGGSFFDWEGKKIDYNLANPTQSYRYTACHPKLLSNVLKLFKDSYN